MSTAISPTAYNYKVVRQFAIMTVVWGILGMGLGVFIASQLVWPQLNLDLPWTSFGRLRPLHTNLVIFAFGGCALFGTSYYVVQRTCQTRLISDSMAAFTFWGWQAVIVGALITLPMGYTTTKEYAELEWPLAILLAIVWVTYGLVFFGTIVKRKTKHIYVGNWFYGAFIVVTAMLHIVNHISLPVSLFKSYSAYSGATDAMIQWWYGHNAVGFFLTTGFLGMMYYFVPKQAERPIYSYRLSIVHFWALITLYIWAGPHHLHYTALPDWAQSLGMVMSIILLAPSWGGMINGMMTLSGAWHKLRTDPILRFLVVSLAFYGMSTFEGPMGGDDLDRRRVPHDPAPVWPRADAQRRPDQRALLAGHHRYRAVHRLDVGKRHHPRPDVARHQRRRHPHLLLRRSPAGQPPWLYRPRPGRCVLRHRHAADGLQRVPYRTCRQPGTG
ncbi:cytochrome c oxidase subunit I [Pseudomonas sp. CES]|nr:cytochrome c oxidase subunit I [Pseudomonas sp. CES]